MRTLRLTQSSAGVNGYRVEIVLNGDDLDRQVADTEFDFAITPQDQEDMRWYLEDYLQYAADPAPKIAARIEGRMAELGSELFAKVFDGSDAARQLWSTMREQLQETRVEIITGVRDANALPWELLRDPHHGTWLALKSAALVRASSRGTRSASYPLSPETSGPIRILLVICRPGGSQDVPFRSVATRLIKGLGDSARDAFQLDVLRPPTFAKLTQVLQRARDEGHPYHVVHFDGHGTYADLEAQYTNQPARNFRGYLVFENSEFRGNEELKDGTTVGALLAECGVPVLLLNACRSAHAEAPPAPETVDVAGHNPHGDGVGHESAFGSLAQEVIDAGVLGVLAMRYNVYVVTAAQFVADLYASLAGGRTLAEAVALGCKRLNDEPLRELSYPPRPLQDWMVPIAYEAAPVTLFPRTATDGTLKIETSGVTAICRSDALPHELSDRTDAGFIGRDETLLAIDRAFETRRVVLLSGYAGSGKTSTAAEFTRWYRTTGGVDGPLLFTSFTNHKTLAQAINEGVGAVWSGSSEIRRTEWASLSDEARYQEALQTLGQIPVLLIWDNVEPIAGFPRGTTSAWSAEEQQALDAFLRAASTTKAKFLLTSRRDEQDWLGNLPIRISMTPMHTRERVQLVQALARKCGEEFVNTFSWGALLSFTAGNPLAITILARQALAEKLKSEEQIKTFVTHLCAGDAMIADEVSDDRSRSLDASLNYGFEQAFSQAELSQLALLHLFQGVVCTDVFCLMGRADRKWCLHELRALSVEAATNLLNRSVELGMLERRGGGYYRIHPALPWFLKSLFDACYPAVDFPLGDHSVKRAAVCSYTEAVGWWGESLSREYSSGDRSLISVLSREENNILHAFHLGRENQLLNASLRALHAIRVLYKDTGRSKQWEPLLSLIVPDVTDLTNDGPRQGLEDEWSAVTEYRVHLAKNLADAKRLSFLRIRFHWNKTAAYSHLAHHQLDEVQLYELRQLAVAEEQLGTTLYGHGDKDCLSHLKDALSLYQTIRDRLAEAVVSHQIAMAYAIPSLRSPDQQRVWLLRSLELRPESDQVGRGRCLERLGALSFYTFVGASQSRAVDEEIFNHLSDAIGFHQAALSLFPTEAVFELAGAHYGLARSLRELTRLLPDDITYQQDCFAHYLKAIDAFEAIGDIFHAGGCRLEVAPMLANSGRLADAREFALASLHDYERTQGPSSDLAQSARTLIHQIENLIHRHPV